jgi:hypothetical protein
VSTATKRLSDAVLAGLTVLGGIVSLLTLYPRVTITTDFDKTDASASSFLISNDGYLPAYSVTVYCLLGVLDMGPSNGTSSVSPNEMKADLGPAFRNGELAITTLMPGAKETVPWSSCFPFRPGPNLHVSAARVGLRARYRPLLWPWKRTVTQEVYARDLGDGRYYWYSIPYLK